MTTHNTLLIAPNAVSPLTPLKYKAGGGGATLDDSFLPSPSFFLNMAYSASADEIIALLLRGWRKLRESIRPAWCIKTKHALVFWDIVDERFIHFNANDGVDCCSPFPFCKQNLRKICREKLGLSPRHCIDFRILIEAVTLLLTRDWLVREIADHLGFKDLSWFSKFIRKYTGMAPSALRRAFS